MRFASLFALLCLLPWCARAAEDPEIGALFAERGVTGTLVIASLDGATRYVHNESRAATPFSPASTFKILNTLIALEEGVAKDENHPFAWDGQAREFPDWNRDHTLASAFKVSCVWCYQALAQEIGGERYQTWLERVGFGRLAAGFETTRFWLDGALTVDALGQVEFLRKLVRRELPFGGHAYEVLARVMVADSTAAYTLRAKTGWAADPSPQVGWYVGYVERPEGIWLFATNIEIRERAQLPLRQELTRLSLKRKGIIE